MSLVFAAVTPHPPMLIPSVGKDAIKKFNKTIESYHKIEEELYLSKPDILLVISPHGSMFSDSFTVNVCPEFETDLREFGDLTTKLKFKGEMNLPAKLCHATRDEAGMPVKMVSEPKLDHGSAVPLFYLTSHLPNITIAQIGFCEKDFKTHLEFGYLLKEQIMDSNKRIAVIASCDLSHALTSDSPAGYHPAGVEFDTKIQELLATNNIAGMLNLDENLVSNSAECGLRSILILMGVLKNMKISYKSLSYESPFGVGYLTAYYSL